MLRIALREVAEAASLEETTAELSQLAEICVVEVLQHWDAELRSRLGAPRAELAVLALGKLGGRELNHSSDIDVIFLYSEEGQVTPTLTYHEWFNRLATKVFETFAANDPAGALFRMDLRLRPEGSAGPMARDLFQEPIALQPDGTLVVPTGPGIGVEPDPEAIERYRVRDD